MARSTSAPRALAQFIARMSMGLGRVEMKLLSVAALSLLIGGSPLLSEMARASAYLVGRSHDTQMAYLCRGLQRGPSAELEHACLRSHQALLTKHDGAGIVVAGDGSAIVKPRARCPGGVHEGHAPLEGLQRLYDGASGEVVTGFPMLCVTAVGTDEIARTVALHTYSKFEKGHRSTNEEWRRLLSRVAPYVGSKATWVWDRGHDSSQFIQVLDELALSSVIRMNTHERARNLAVSGECVPMREAVLRVVPKYTSWVRIGKRRLKLEFGIRRVYMMESDKPVGPPRTLLVAWCNQIAKENGSVKPFLVLLSTTEVRGKAAALWMMTAYRKRWRVEEHIRILKDSRRFGPRLNDIRVRSIKARRMLLMAICVVLQFTRWVEGRRRTLCRAAMESVPVCGGKVKRELGYRIFRGLGELLRRSRVSTWGYLVGGFVD